MSTIQNIQFLSLEYESRINDVQERYRVLYLSDYSIDPEELHESNKLKEIFDSLTYESKNINYRLTPVKLKFTEITKAEIDNFSKILTAFAERFKEEGPGSVGKDLDLGLSFLEVIFLKIYF